MDKSLAKTKEQDGPTEIPCIIVVPKQQDSSDQAPSTARASARSSSFSSTRSNASSKKLTSQDGDAKSTSETLPSSRRRSPAKIILIHPPSAFHPDIYPPSLVRVQRALRSHHRGTHPADSSHAKAGARSGQPSVRSRFRDDQGRFILEGSSGGYYVGDVFGGLPHGRGQHYIPLLPQGKMHLLYDGSWVHGSKTGKGSVYYTNGEEYRGELRQNQRWGSGWMRYKDGSFYAGDWLRGRRHGVGFRCHKDGNCYCGSFCKDSQDGYGTFYWLSMMRKFEGEWVVNQPYSGYYSRIDMKDFEDIQSRLTKLGPEAIGCIPFEKLQDKDTEIVHLELQNPFWAIFGVICELRAQRTRDLDSKNLFKTQVGRKENLSAAHLQVLKKVFEAIAPTADKTAKLPAVHLRRLLVLACIDPDKGQGEKLLEHLQQQCTQNKTTVSFNELLFYILQYHFP